jgi:hypothetical protein
MNEGHAFWFRVALLFLCMVFCLLVSGCAESLRETSHCAQVHGQEKQQREKKKRKKKKKKKKKRG